MEAPNAVTLARRGELAWLVIERAEKANALTPVMMATLSSHLAACAGDADVKALVLTGAGSRVFCAGVDVRTATDVPPNETRQLRSERLFQLLIALAGYPKPVIVRMNGVASGGGAMLALLADRVVAVESAYLAFPEIDLGGPTLPGLAIVRHLCGAALASDLIQSARRMPAPEAAERGLIAEVVAPDALDACTERAALLLGSKPANAFDVNKRWLRAPLLEALHAAEGEHRRLRAQGAIP